MDKVIYLFRKVGGEMRIESIEEKAKDTIEKYSFNEFPIDPVKIALKVGIAVRDVQFKDIAEDSVCGGIIKENESIEIYVNKYDPINRKRFTIAHELGHYFLGHLENKGECIDLHRGINNENKIIEIQANAFAAALLMEKNRVEYSFNTLKKVGFSNENIILELSKLFAVSASAMNLRVQKLGLM